MQNFSEICFNMHEQNALWNCRNEKLKVDLIAMIQETYFDEWTWQPIWHVSSFFGSIHPKLCSEEEHHWKRSDAFFFILLLFSLTKVAGVSDTKKAFLRMCTADLQISHAGRITLSIAILFKLQYSVKGLDTKNIN